MRVHSKLLKLKIRASKKFLAKQSRGLDQTIAEAERLMRAGDLRRLPVLTHEKRMVGIVTLEDIVREQRATNS